MKLKEIDESILRLIQKGNMCMPRTTKIAKTLGLPPSTVHERLIKMKKEGIIQGYMGILDKDKVDRGFVSFILGQIKLDNLQKNPRFFEDLGKNLADYPFVQEVYFISGGTADVLCKVVCKDKNDYYDKARKVVKYFDLRGWGSIATKCIKDVPVVDL